MLVLVLSCGASMKNSLADERGKVNNERMTRPVSIVTVSYDTFFFVRLLVERVRQMVRSRPYEIVVVDRGSRDGTREWLGIQPDVHLVKTGANRRGHGHGEAAELGATKAQFNHVVLLDSDAHPIDPRWLE